MFAGELEGMVDHRHVWALRVPEHERVFLVTPRV
jgi:hypothetical protein